MTDPRVEEIKTLLPRCLLPDWVRLGSRLARVVRDRNHEGRHDALIDRLLERARASVALRTWRAEHRPVPTYPEELPVAARREEIIDTLRRHSVVVIAGETGSGKTTQLPKMLLEAGCGELGRIGCTQPRRLAALSVSRRIAEELGVPWGREVGCKIRFDDRTSPETMIKLMTDGILLAEVQGDPWLSEYDGLILDEAHERSLNVDFLLGHLRGVLARRPDLKLVITSATIDTAVFAAAFGGAPVIEVSGRVYPVEVIYAPPEDASAEEPADVGYTEAAVAAVGRVLAEGVPGDVLVFLPGERDIREVADQVEGQWRGQVEVIPLYGRLSAGEQQRVFAPGGRRRVVVSTNIAETSLTIPGIRYVIDAGLARISRYNPRTRTKRLPIEAVSQSSANQRKGRAGRVQDGVCIRLYAEDDFVARPRDTQPEIQRSNLAEVILRMKAFHLGDIETFPFLNPPLPAAIRAGYDLLHELGALNERQELTPLGRDLARLPIDPTLGRMLLQAGKEGAVREVLIIASALSIQDPRERPLDRQAAADTAHRRYLSPRSDFLTWLNLWRAVHDEWERLPTQNQRRRFCREQFLSYVRMREWQDLHAQLEEVLGEMGSVARGGPPATPESVHRCILSGLLGHVGRRLERNQYQASGNRRVMVFPGSVVFDRSERAPRGGSKGKDRERPEQGKVLQPEWVMAGEIVETTQLYGRTLAGVDPRWIVELGDHLVKRTRRNPRWDPVAGQVMVEEIATLWGMELQRRWVAYERFAPEEANALFLRGALVEENLLPPPPPEPEEDGGERDARRSMGEVRSRLRQWATPVSGETPLPAIYAFVEHNRRVRQKIDEWRTRLRRDVVGDVDEALFQFYAARLKGVASRDALHRWLGEHGGSTSLCVQESDLTGGKELAVDEVAYPDTLMVAGQPVGIRYAYAPGEDHDGVTIRVPFGLADRVTTSALEWAVPGMRRDKAEEWLRALPKSARAQLQPLAPKADDLAREFQPSGPSLFHDLAAFLERKYGVRVSPDTWTADRLPPHMRTRVEVLGPGDQPMGASRDLTQLRQRLAAAPPAAPPSTEAWARAAAQWEKAGVTAWTFGDLPERVTVAEGAGGTLYGWPGLRCVQGEVSVVLHRSETEARTGNRAGWQRLIELALGRDWAWVQKDLRGLSAWANAYAPLGTLEALTESVLAHLRMVVFPAEAPIPLTGSAFRAAVETVRARLPGAVGPLMQKVGEILVLRAEVAGKLGLSGRAAAPGTAGKPPVAVKAAGQVLKDFSQLRVATSAPAPVRLVGGGAVGVGPTKLGEAELMALIPARFPERIPPAWLGHVPRFLKALKVRVERASLNPAKDRERQALFQPLAKAWEELRKQPGSESKCREVAAFRWWLEEYRVSLFAQELGTSMPVSAKRLENELARLRMLP